jgi:hypothetical protein
LLSDLHYPDGIIRGEAAHHTVHDAILKLNRVGRGALGDIDAFLGLLYRPTALVFAGYTGSLAALKEVTIAGDWSSVMGVS